MLPESFQKAYPDVLKQNQLKADQREWNRVKDPSEDYENFYSPSKLKLPNIRQLQYPGGLSQKGKVNNFTKAKGGVT